MSKKDILIGLPVLIFASVIYFGLTAVYWFIFKPWMAGILGIDLGSLPIGVH